MKAEKLIALAKDLNKEFPSSPRAMLGGYVILPRCLDKARAALAETNGEYNFWPCSLCAELETFTGVDHGEMKDFVATGADDEEVAEWFQSKSRIKDSIEIIRWNNKMRGMRPSEMPDDAQAFLETYVQENLPSGKPVYVWFDVFDIEEGRL